MPELQRSLTLKDGIPLAVGSIIGSGILFLPSLITAISSHNIIYVWLLTALFCVPLLFIFASMVNAVPHESGIEGFISLGLGERVGAAIPWLLLGTVPIGISASAFIVGAFMSRLLAGGIPVQTFTAVIVILLGVLSNLYGVRLGATVQLLMAFLLFTVGTLLFLLTAVPAQSHYTVLFNSFNFSTIAPGMVVAFWGYSGFENLTFMSGEFKNPQRDFKLSALIALFICTILYLCLSMNYVSLIPLAAVNPVIGLYQLSEAVNALFHPTFIITLFACAAVQINCNSWTWGISRLIYASANKNKLPAYFSTLSRHYIPQRAIFLLAVLFLTGLIVYALFPQVLKPALILVSTDYVFIYALCLLSYLCFNQKRVVRIATAIFFVLMVGLLISSKWLLLYPFCLFMVGVIYFKPDRKILLNK